MKAGLVMLRTGCSFIMVDIIGMVSMTVTMVVIDRDVNLMEALCIMRMCRRRREHAVIGERQGNQKRHEFAHRLHQTCL